MNLFDKRFVVNTGKGGVGKSTLTAAIALAAAKRGQRVLVLELNTKERISRYFGKPEVGEEITRIHDNIWAVNVKPESAMKEYVLMTLRFETIYKAVFENRFVSQFLRVIPGLNDLVLIGKAWFHEQEQNKDGTPTWDMVVVDAPATGHGLFLLQIPKVIVDAVPTGPMANECRKILDLLTDPKRTALNLITLTEEMPVNETIELKAKLDKSLQVPMGYLIANGIFPSVFTPYEAKHLETLRNTANTPANPRLKALLEAGLFRFERCELQSRYLDQLKRSVSLPIIEVPQYFEPDINLDVLRRMAAHVEACVEQQASAA
ncbi:MAG: AAA family ATPase [Myxococcales bacterium]|nr:AAA family ATPase [Myxococcales bacterium]